MISFGQTAFFRDTQLQAKLLIFDARMVIPLFMMLLHIRIWTIIVFISFLAISVFVERKGMRLENAVRRIRAWSVGKWRPARGHDYIRQPVDFSYEARMNPRLFADLIDEKSEYTSPSGASFGQKEGPSYA